MGTSRVDAEQRRTFKTNINDSTPVPTMVIIASMVIVIVEIIIIYTINNVLNNGINRGKK